MFKNIMIATIVIAFSSYAIIEAGLHFMGGNGQGHGPTTNPNDQKVIDTGNYIDIYNNDIHLTRSVIPFTPPYTIHMDHANRTITITNNSGIKKVINNVAYLTVYAIGQKPLMINSWYDSTHVINN